MRDSIEYLLIRDRLSETRLCKVQTADNLIGSGGVSGSASYVKSAFLVRRFVR